jgi:DNA-binding NarL/FixJ family response regulator
MEEKILLVDHRLSMRAALRLYLARFPDEWIIVGEADTLDIATIMRQIDEREPEIMILCRQTAGDLLQSPMHELRTRYPRLALLVTGVQPEAVATITAWGANGVLLTTDTPPTLLTRLRVLRYDRDV